MSHTTTITGLRITDMRALAAAVQRIPGASLEVLQAPQDRRLYQSEVIPGVIASVRLPDWRYPALIDTSGALHYDNYRGMWGSTKHVEALRQGYATERARSLARAQGYAVRETAKADGSITLTLTR